MDIQRNQPSRKSKTRKIRSLSPPKKSAHTLIKKRTLKKTPSRQTRAKSSSPSVSSILTPTPTSTLAPTPANPLTDTFARLLRTEFASASPPLFDIVTEYGEYDTNHQLPFDSIYGLACQDKSQCECFALRIYGGPSPYIHIERIRHRYGKNCKLSGNQIIGKLTKVFRTFPELRVQIYDTSRIYVMVDGEEKEIKLPIYNILLHGKSWYNRHGYLSDNHIRESEHNEVLAQTPIHSRLLKELNEILGEHALPNNITFRGFATEVDRQIRSPTIPEETKNLYLKAYLIVEKYLTDAKQKRIKYDWYSLYLQPEL